MRRCRAYTLRSLTQRHTLCPFRFPVCTSARFPVCTSALHFSRSVPKFAKISQIALFCLFAMLRYVSCFAACIPHTSLNPRILRASLTHPSHIPCTSLTYPACVKIWRLGVTLCALCTCCTLCTLARLRSAYNAPLCAKTVRRFLTLAPLRVR